MKNPLIDALVDEYRAAVHAALAAPAGGARRALLADEAAWILDQAADAGVLDAMNERLSHVLA